MPTTGRSDSSTAYLSNEDGFVCACQAAKSEDNLEDSMRTKTIGPELRARTGSLAMRAFWRLRGRGFLGD